MVTIRKLKNYFYKPLVSIMIEALLNHGTILRGWVSVITCTCEKKLSEKICMRLENNKRLKIFTWHIHGTYLFYLSKGDYDIYIPFDNSKGEGYCGRGSTFPFGANVIEVPAAEIRHLTFDCILFQTNKNYFTDQYEVLSEDQRTLPRVYVEHDPPWKDPVDSIHPVTDNEVVTVHVTPYNKLMWHNLNTMVRVVDHGICPQPASYTGELEKGIVVINHLHQRKRKLGADLFDTLAKDIPLDLVGMGTAAYGGLGEVLHPQLPAFAARYRFFFNPIRYTSLGLAVLEAMMLGLPVVAFATTEYTTVIRDGYNGFIHTDPAYLAEKMKLLLTDAALAKQLGENAKASVEDRFNINRFTSEWKEVFLTAINHKKNRHEKANSVYQ